MQQADQLIRMTAQHLGEKMNNERKIFMSDFFIVCFPNVTTTNICCF